MYYRVWLFIFFLFHFSLRGQSLISPYAGDVLAGNSRTTYSFGEIAINQASANSHLVTEGQQQPLILLSDISYGHSENDFFLYPNPTGHLLHFNSMSFGQDRFLYKICSVDGVVLMGWQNLDQNIINVRTLLPGSYQVSLKNVKTNHHCFVNFVKI